MGVTVNFYCEVLQNGKWQFECRMIADPDYGIDAVDVPLIPESLFETSIKEYAAIFTDTRNPIRSDSSYTPVVPLRGLPNDLSLELREHFNAYLTSYPSGGLYFSWFTVRELADFDLESHEMKRRAYVHESVVHLFYGCPRGFPINGWPNEIPIRFAEWSSDGEEVTWIEKYSNIVSGFSEQVVPIVEAKGPSDEVRILVSCGG